MKILIKLKAILLTFLIVFATQSVLADQILPIPKPVVGEEAKKIVKKKKKFILKKNL